jgi:hypothetical protein
MKHRARTRDYPSYVVHLLFTLKRKGKLDGRQRLALHRLELLGENDQLTLYGKMVLARYIQNNQRQQPTVQEETTPAWRTDEDTQAPTTKIEITS